MRSDKSISATNLAVYQHLECDLYIHKVYNASALPNPSSNTTSRTSEATKSLFKRGNDWEAALYSWLDRSKLLLRIPQLPLNADNLLENIQADTRDYFFITGVVFNPPQSKLNDRFAEHGAQALQFGLAKPDLIEITKSQNEVRWRVIDAKASKNIKSSHYVQLYFYSLCLGHLLDRSPYRNMDSVAVWLPPDDGLFPSTENINAIQTSVLSPVLDNFLFRELPQVITSANEHVQWHYNPLCRTCPFERECRSRAKTQKSFGSMPNISLDDVKILRELLLVSGIRDGSPTDRQPTDIEDLHKLVTTPAILDQISTSSPAIVKRAKQLLAIGTEFPSRHGTISSPVVDAARTGNVQIIQRRNFSCPNGEDIAIIISILNDPSAGSSNDYFCITTYPDEDHLRANLPIILCPAQSIIPSLASLIRSIHEFQCKSAITSTSQFYMWSIEEYKILEGHIIETALNSLSTDEDIQVCISALAQGTSLLQTTFQPLILSGTLLSFLANRNRSLEEYRICLERMGLAVEGTMETLRKRIETEVTRLQASPQGSNRREIGRLPLVVVLKQEIERQLALPIPGHWDLHECSASLLATSTCPTNEQIFVAFKDPQQLDHLKSLLVHKNDTIYSLLKDLRVRSLTVTGQTLLVNKARPISVDFMVLCKEPHIRKLFYMQQFEVLSALKELWRSRMEGNSGSPVLEYENMVYDPTNPRYVFRLVSGIIDTPPSDRTISFYSQLLVADTANLLDGNSSMDGLPLEALFNDLEVSGLVFPPNRYASMKWSRQEPRVQSGLFLADVQSIHTEKIDSTTVTLQVWGSAKFQPKIGARYRLSPRFIDFNTAKVLSSLLDIDLSWAFQQQKDEINAHGNIPFLQLITDPRSLNATSAPACFLKVEDDIQKLLQNLRALGNIKAEFLVLKPSQHKAAKNILSNRLTVIWGPPGTGKTHTICLSLLRLLEVEHRQNGRQDRIVFITAATHAAIEACRGKLIELMEVYKSIRWLPKEWLQDITVEVVSRGNDHPAPTRENSKVHVYAGTIYQLYNFSRKNDIKVDCVIIDEAGQVLLVSTSLVLRRLRDTGRIIVAGDSQQLAPILNARYPVVKPMMLFGSILDCLMSAKSTKSGVIEVVQLTENFRLNPDLGEFISTIYSEEFKAQKNRALQFASAIMSLSAYQTPLAIRPSTFNAIRQFLSALSKVISAQHQQHLVAPTTQPPSEVGVSDSPVDGITMKRPFSLTLIRIRNENSLPYESQVRREADIATSLVLLLQECSPNNSVFVATPHRIQRDAVRFALSRANRNRAEKTPVAAVRHTTAGNLGLKYVVVDTIERLQGSEAEFVICLFSSLQASSQDAIFLLERRRLNVAISQAKTLCILITCDGLLLPSVRILSNPEALKGYMFLKAYERRAWSYIFPEDVRNA